MDAAAVPSANDQSRFAPYAWGVLAYNVAVILWGAFVRATGSGAGCGRHWPACNGEVVPRAPAMATVIEYTHRLTSGIALIAVVILVVWAWRRYQRRHPVRLAAGLSLVAILAEAAIGAGIVLLELVADNASLGRAAIMGAHLVNTFLLLGGLGLVAWWGGGRPLPARSAPPSAPPRWTLWTVTAGLLLTAMTGGIAALGDTLFPAGSLSEGLRQDLDPLAHFLIRLRVLHPLVAIAAGVGALLYGEAARRTLAGRAGARLPRLLGSLVLVQLGWGVLNLVLLAPVWAQLVHLLLADLVWLAFVLTAASAAAVPAPTSSADPTAAGTDAAGGAAATSATQHSQLS